MLSSVVPRCSCKTEFVLNAQIPSLDERICVYFVLKNFRYAFAHRFASLRCSIHFRDSQSKIYISWALIFSSVRAQFWMLFCRKFSHSRALSLQRRFTPNKIVQVDSKVVFFSNFYIFSHKERLSKTRRNFFSGHKKLCLFSFCDIPSSFSSKHRLSILAEKKKINKSSNIESFYVLF